MNNKFIVGKVSRMETNGGSLIKHGNFLCLTNLTFKTFADIHTQKLFDDYFENSRVGLPTPPLFPTLLFYPRQINQYRKV